MKHRKNAARSMGIGDGDTDCIETAVINSSLLVDCRLFFRLWESVLSRPSPPFKFSTRPNNN